MLIIVLIHFVVTAYWTMIRMLEASMMPAITAHHLVVMELLVHLLVILEGRLFRVTTTTSLCIHLQIVCYSWITRRSDAMIQLVEHQLLLHVYLLLLLMVLLVVGRCLLLLLIDALLVLLLQLLQ